MIQNKVLRLLKGTLLPNGIKLSEGQELEIVMDVVYMNGYPIPFNMQVMVLNFIKDNGDLFIDVTKQW